MASTMSTYYGSGIVCQNLLKAVVLTLRLKPCPAVGVVVATVNSRPWRSAAVVVRAEGNPEIRKTEEKVVDCVVVTELSKTPYCLLQMFEVRYFPSLRWKRCKTQQSYTGQYWAFALEEAVNNKFINIGFNFCHGFEFLSNVNFYY